jgi:hypothetical protein
MEELENILRAQGQSDFPRPALDVLAAPRLYTVHQVRIV